MDDEVQDLIVSEVQAVLNIARVQMSDVHKVVLRQMLTTDMRVKITIPYSGDESSSFRMETCNSDVENRVTFFYRGEEQLDLNNRVMRPVMRLMEARERQGAAH